MLTGNLRVVNIIFWTSNIFLLAESHVGSLSFAEREVFLQVFVGSLLAELDLNVEAMGRRLLVCLDRVSARWCLGKTRHLPSLLCGGRLFGCCIFSFTPKLPLRHAAGGIARAGTAVFTSNKD